MNMRSSKLQRYCADILAFRKMIDENVLCRYLRVEKNVCPECCRLQCVERKVRGGLAWISQE